MLRLVLFTTLLSCALAAESVAAEPTVLSVVLADHVAASSMPPLPPGTPAAVLIEHDDDDVGIIEARAIAMRHATHFVYVPRNETPLSAMYRQRLTAQGAIPVALPTPPRLGNPSIRSRPFPTFDSLLATSSIRP
ncbi:hypothetical protein [Neorhodopirellula pilleata]|uniref:Uncharacterized protein n=1 Tax=Neorhodopirellula pilleata TaxID=2714738 RepID=A0A5C6AB53_9BACT|nr:hypothetical protein [Neorhodopirellula pilleata]TWT96587.1 hypothetical protein Pla100_30700 [Neorhodopirellula pilleata]